MKSWWQLPSFLVTLIIVCVLHACKSQQDDFVTVRDGQFFLGDTPYRYIGTNVWYAPILASEGEGGNRERLNQELDDLCRLGIRNLRILVGAEGTTYYADHVRPTMQPQPGVYNDTLLQGLDYLMEEMGRRDMKAVLYLHNAWQWSGGYGTYLEWAGMGTPAPASVWNEYTAHHSQFLRNDSARAMALRHTRFIVSRTNTVTGKPYANDPTIMAWEICNEPRAFARDTLTKRCYYEWIREQARAIKKLDPKHLVTTGSEGLYGSEMDFPLYERVHALSDIDYLTIHIWPYTWGWTGPFVSPNSLARQQLPLDALTTGLDEAIRLTSQYIDDHVYVAQRLHKPLVLEEFGYPRDGFEIAPGTPTTARDSYYRNVLSRFTSDEGSPLAGINFWAWGGRALPQHPFWLPGDPYTGDPAQEEQGLYSIFLSDSTTLNVISNALK